MKTKIFVLVLLTMGATAAGLQLAGCSSVGAVTSRASAAEKVYVAPGELDKYYAFLSGGQSGSVFVVGIPSGRLIKEIPIFEP
ncbi:MAG: nitrous oxide reductase, partial [Acidobacteria bacterium]|nr:nitrous oxide reductase [Acidobacteriota bacterium]